MAGEGVEEGEEEEEEGGGEEGEGGAAEEPDGQTRHGESKGYERYEPKGEKIGWLLSI